MKNRARTANDRSDRITHFQVETLILLMRSRIEHSTKIDIQSRLISANPSDFPHAGPHACSHSCVSGLKPKAGRETIE